MPYTEGDGPIVRNGKKFCKVVLSSGAPCKFPAIEGSDLCGIHGGNRDVEQKEKENLRLYRIEKYQRRLDDLRDHSRARSLRDEIGLLRIVLENIMNSIDPDSQVDWLAHSTTIGRMAIDIEKLVVSCQKLEMQSGQVLDRSQALLLAQEIVNVLVEEIDDEELLSRLSDRIGETIENAMTVPEDDSF